jgi:hypothetical protein
MGILPHEEILKLHEAAVAAALAPDRAALLAGLDPRLVAGLKGASSPAATLLRDLTDLNALHDGASLAIWLANAARLSAGRMETSTFEEALDKLRAPDPGRPVRAGQSTLCDLRHGPTRLYVTSELWDVTCPLQADLAVPAGLLLERILEALRLPRSLQHDDRAGVRFKYSLSVRGLTLARAEPLSDQGIHAGDVLWLVTKLVPFAGTEPVEGLMQAAMFRGGGDLERDEADRERIRDAFRRAGLLGGRA